MKWRRFFPQKTKQHAYSVTDIFESARDFLSSTDIHSFEQLPSLIDERRSEAQTTLDWLILLIMQAPRAAIAQESMDKHPHGYKQREKRLFELIDFNDTFVATVLLLPEEDLAGFVEKLKVEIDYFCRQLRTKSFSDKQYEAITHGLSREIAVYAAAKKHGFEVMMTSRVADAFGIDIQIRDSETGKYINVDSKTGSSFYFRIRDLVQQGRMAPHDMVDAETKGYWEIVNRDEGRQVRLILLRVDQDELGPIIAFRFQDETVLVERLERIITLRGLSDGQFGRLT